MASQTNIPTATDHNLTTTPRPSASHSKSSPAEPLYTPPPSALLTATHHPSHPPPPLHNKANISIRTYIYFLPFPLPAGTPVPYSTGLPHRNPLNLPPHQFEPTSTLVLTSPRATFVDLRFYKPRKEGETTLPNHGERERLEWGFGGGSESFVYPRQDSNTSTTNGASASASATNVGAELKARVGEGGPNEQDNLKPTSHSKWTHWIDTRHAVGSPSIPIDEGDMYTISPTLTLEHGHAFQPLMGKVVSHEEMWEDEVIESTTGEQSELVEGKPGQDGKGGIGGTKVCIVLRVQDDTAGVRGLVVRLGQYCQGIVMKGEYSTVERWEWKGELKSERERDSEHGETKGEPSDSEHRGQNGRERDRGRRESEHEETVGKDKTFEGLKVTDSGWKRTARIGDQFLPCSVTFRPEILAVGGKVKYFDYEWEVEECWEWE